MIPNNETKFDQFDCMITWIDITFQAFNAAKSCFLPDEEKKELIKTLKKVYGVEDWKVKQLPCLHNQWKSNEDVFFYYMAH